MSQSTARRTRAAAITSAAVAAGFLLPSAAHAVVTTTTVTSPAPETIFDAQLYSVIGEGRQEMTVAGVAPGAADGEEVKLVCTYTLNGVLYANAVYADGPVIVEDGAFSVRTSSVPSLPCRLRAVPEDFDDESMLPESTDLSAWSGPRLIGGGFGLSEIDDPGSPLHGSQVYATQRGQAKGLVFATGSGLGGGGGIGGGFGIGGGIVLTALLDDTYYRPLFGPSGFLTSFGIGIGGGEDDEGEFGLGQFGLIVDGRAAVSVPHVGGEPSKVLARRFDPQTADQTIVERVPVSLLVLDSAGGFEGLEPSGIALIRTLQQDREGRRVTLGDEFVSTDGAGHRVEARYLQALYSTLVGEEDDDSSIQEPPSYRIPWATGDAYVQPATGAEYGPAPAGPTTIWVHGARQDFSSIGGDPDVRARRADGDLLPRAEGAYRFASAPSSVRFMQNGMFVASFVRDVAAGASARVDQTFLQDLTQDGLDDLATPPAPPATPPAPPIVTNTPLPTQPPVLPAMPTQKNPLPRLAKSTGKILFTKKQGQRLRDRKPITVTTSNMPAGRYGVTIRRWVKNGRTLASGVKTIKKDGRLKVKLRLSKYGKKYFGLKKTRNRKSVKVRVIVTWTPPGKGRLKQKTSYTTNFR